MGIDKYKVEIADNTYWRKQIKCQWGCPVNTDSRGYVIAIAEGRYLDAYKIARGPNPFASICGRVCGAPCEVECRRGDIDDPVTIRALKRFVTEQFGVEAVDPKDTIAFSTARRDPDNPKTGAKVAVVGAGVAGLSAAHDLALLGYKVTVFESNFEAGGMLTTGVPLYRLPRELVQAEIQAILSMGVELRLNTEVGKDVTMNAIMKEYEAALIAVGLQKSRVLNIEGGQLDGVLHGIEFLKLVNEGQDVKLGDRVVVIGGGNVAFDVARSALRKQVGEDYRADAEDFYEAGDAARTALRLGAKEVHMVCLESLAEMPADSIEIEEGLEEGVKLHVSRGPDKILGKNGKVIGLATRIVETVFDENGRFNPAFREGDGEIIGADTVILAIGQSGDFGFLSDGPEVEIAKNGIVAVNSVTKATNIPGIYACGDIAEGAKLFINAIESGQIAALSIDQYIRKKEINIDLTGTMDIPGSHKMPEGYVQLDRQNPPVKEAEARSRSSETIEFNYPETTARQQGVRCLKCHINTIFNGATCIMCNGCVDVCPTHCLKLVPLSELELDEQLESAINNRYGISLRDHPADERTAFLENLGSAMLKDEEKCIRCGFCARRCPTGAVTMEWFSFETNYRYED